MIHAVGILGRIQGFIGRWQAFLMERVFAPGVLWDWFWSIVYAAAVLVAAQLLIKVAGSLVDRGLSVQWGSDPVQDKQRKTLGVITKSVIRYVITFIAILTVLSHFGVDTTQLLAAAGVLGLAVGFGAQALVKDFIAGFFMLYENQYSIGDHVDAAGHSGTVHFMGLRVTVLKDFGGQLHFIPNGSIGTVTNYSRGEMRVLVEVDVAYEEDLTRVMEVLTEACEAMASESEDMVEGPKPLGVSGLGDSGVSITLWGRANAGTQWAMSRELRLRAKRALDAAGIEIPYPRRVVVPAHITSVDREGLTRPS